MSSSDEKYKWKRNADDQWDKSEERGFTGTIVHDEMQLLPYELTILPGPVVSQHATLRNAKNEFRHFLFDKPVST